MDKKKQKPYSEYERQLLVQLVQSKIGILENRKTDAVSQKKKHEAWEELAIEFNNSNVSHTADSKQLKKMWQNMKAKARDAKTLEAQRKRTGGGPAPPEMGPMDTQVIAVMPQIMPSIDVPIDCDTLTTVEAGTGYDNDGESWRPKRARVSSIEATLESVIQPGTSQDWTDEAGLTETTVEVTTKSEPSQLSATPSAIRKNKTSFEDIKKKLLWQELDNNKKKFEIEVEHMKLKNQLEIEFLRHKYKLELEILQFKKESENK
ncbi:myb/SANT-like DNA-binding domain-containing protein 3 [Pieris napi]|uniref:myb/SANT-like DNA-binding domain-containing protein 3 n=1 Tax=Pieris napi TaxID=78633 RepID=UPI001FB9F955|nr:myb/SANT-like DNA-binding domain-containing protein 3 [Pieris napi]